MSVDPTRLLRCYEVARQALLAERNSSGYWTGELSTSALSTATAVMALEMVRRTDADSFAHASLITAGVRWLASHQNSDGGWGDTVQSVSNISTTMLAHAVFHATGSVDEFRMVVDAAVDYIERTGGVEAVLARYGKDRTFSIPILTHCALAGLVDWKHVLPLPFELACLPAKFYKTVRLPVVSYALPALIAIGQVRYHHRKPWNPLTRMLRPFAVEPSLRVLERIQPTSGGFLEATPLTSFVTMSLAGMGRADHPVARKGVEFIVNSVRADGSWPIDTNLATWVTTLSVNALGDDLPKEEREPIREWLLNQQYREVHPYTNADPGGWAWTDLPGGVPDADDTPGAILALLQLVESRESRVESKKSRNTTQADDLSSALRWLLDLQNRDGGWPTFCRGWGSLPFDRSAPDLTAHCIRALYQSCEATDSTWIPFDEWDIDPKTSRFRSACAAGRGFRYLASTQREDGSWLPLWFGNQHAPHDENSTYGTARVLAAYRDAGLLKSPPAQAGLDWLRRNQNPNGGWGGLKGTPSSVEETALATEAVVCADPHSQSARRGLEWLLEAVESGRFRETSPIGFYFAKLWYFETLYPLIFTVSALRHAVEQLEPSAAREELSTPA